MKLYKIYGLYCLTTLKIRYIGITSQPLKLRLYQHLKTPLKNYYKNNWINSVNKNIGIKLLNENLSFKDARKLEILLIKKYKDTHKLTNLTDRGFCGDLRTLKKKSCEKIKNTLILKHKLGLIKKSGEKEVFVYDKNGNYLERFDNAKLCSVFLKIPYSKVGNICNSGGYYKNYTFSRLPILPIKNYIKCYDILEESCKLFFKKEDLCEHINNLKITSNKINSCNFNKIYNTNKFYLNRFSIRMDNKKPYHTNNIILCNDKEYNRIDFMIKQENIVTTMYGNIKTALDNNECIFYNNLKITKKTCAWLKLGELLEYLED